MTPFAALLRKGDDPDALERGLAAIGPLLAAAPDELRLRAGAGRVLGFQVS